MTRERAKELAPIMQAYGEGKTVQSRYLQTDCWKDVPFPEWHTDTYYRIKPEPKTRPMTRGEVLYMVTTTPAMVVRNKVRDIPMSPACHAVYNFPLEEQEYAIIDKSGNPVDGWHKFEVTE